MLQPWLATDMHLYPALRGSLCPSWPGISSQASLHSLRCFSLLKASFQSSDGIRRRVTRSRRRAVGCGYLVLLQGMGLIPSYCK